MPSKACREHIELFQVDLRRKEKEAETGQIIGTGGKLAVASAAVTEWLRCHV